VFHIHLLKYPMLIYRGKGDVYFAFRSYFVYYFDELTNYPSVPVTL
jgi:hypothetical protein